MEKKEKIIIDWKQVEDIELDGIDTRDFPDFCDAYISSATYQGRDATEEELEAMSDDGCVVNGLVHEQLF